MKSAKILFLSLLFVMLAACGKEEKDSTAVRLVGRVDIFRTESGSIENDQTIEYRYDEQNRISEMIITDENGVSVSSVFNYPTDNIMEGGGGSVTYMLNSKGSIVSWSYGNQLMQSCTYDSNGYLQKREQSSFGAIPVTNSETYTWGNGNISTIVIEVSLHSDPPVSYSTTLFFEYSLQNKPSSVEFYRECVGVPRGWYGKSALNLPSRITNKSAGFDEQITIYRYETDKKGYPIKIFIQENGGNEELCTVIEYKN